MEEKIPGGYELKNVLEINADNISYDKDPLLLSSNPNGMVPVILDPSTGDGWSQVKMSFFRCEFVP
jgi:hypothetical protein